MKKTLLAVVALAAISLAFVGCPDAGNDPNTPVGSPAYSIPKNYSWTAAGTQDVTTFENYQIIDSDVLAGKTIKPGDVVKITISAKSKTAFKFAQANLVDNSEAAGWWKIVAEQACVLGSEKAESATDTFTSAVSTFTLISEVDNKLLSNGAFKNPIQFVVYIDPVDSLGYKDKAAAYSDGPASIDFSEWDVNVEINPESTEDSGTGTGDGTTPGGDE